MDQIVVEAMGQNSRTIELKDQGPRSFPLPVHRQTHMLGAMRALLLLTSLALAGSVALGQSSNTTAAFDVASVRPSQHVVGPDYNNQFTVSPIGISGRNVTLKYLLAKAYRLQLNQVSGPSWIAQDEYDIEARTPQGATRDQVAHMLQTLVVERFKLTQHTETREMRVYELVAGKSGPKIHAMKSGESESSGTGLHFHGDLGQFADLLAVQLSIPAIENPSEPVRPAHRQRSC